MNVLVCRVKERQQNELIQYISVYKPTEEKSLSEQSYKELRIERMFPLC